MTNSDQLISSYHSILHHEIPAFLYDYLAIPEMQRLKGIGLFCGCDYTRLFNCKFFYSRYDHSLGVALIIWHFTQDKKQTLAGLFHDISSPVFSHVVDFLNNDHVAQVSTEEDNQMILAHSKQLTELLKRDNIILEEISDYKLYPIADNDKPKLSADRLEYMLATAYIMGQFMTLEEIKKVYEDIFISKNEDNINELAFNTLSNGELFTYNVCQVAKIYLSEEDKLALQLLADILKKMVQDKLVTINDFYQLTEVEMIELIMKSKYSDIYHYFTQLTKVNYSSTHVEGKYGIHLEVKKRYIDPLIHHQRISQISPKAKQWLDEIINHQIAAYSYIDLEDFRDAN